MARAILLSKLKGNTDSSLKVKQRFSFTITDLEVSEKIAVEIDLVQ